MGGSVLLTLVVAAVGGVLSSLVTMLGTPRLQYRFWRYQRRTELQLATIQEINRVTAEFIAGHIKDPEALPSTEFFAELDRAKADVRALFSPDSARVVQEVVSMVGPRLGSVDGSRTPNDFADARDVALRALYADALPLPPWWLRWLW